MTILTLRPFRVRAAEGMLGPGALASVLEAVRRRVSEAAACQAGEMVAENAPGDPVRDFAVVWRSRPKGETPPLRACRAALDIVHRLARQEIGIARQHGIALCLHIGIASDGKDGAGPVGDTRVAQRAHLLRMANRLYGTTILVDAVVGEMAARRMAFREVDRMSTGGHSLLRGPEASALANIAVGHLGVFGSAPGGVFELMGLQGALAPARRSAALAFDAARQLYEAGAWTKAAMIFALLAHGTRVDPLAELYLRKCRQHEEEARQLTRALAPETIPSTPSPQGAGDHAAVPGSSLPASAGRDAPDASRP